MTNRPVFVPALEPHRVVDDPQPMPLEPSESDSEPLISAVGHTHLLNAHERLDEIIDTMALLEPTLGPLSSVRITFEVLDD